MIRPFCALPFLFVALALGFIAEHFANVAALIDCKPCSSCGYDHECK